MLQNSLRKFIYTQSTNRTDTFVGIKCEQGNLKIYLPVGFRLDKNDSVLRKDLLMLLNAIKYTADKKSSDNIDARSVQNDFNCRFFPIASFLYVISDYLKRGYYKDREVTFSKSKRGKIHWGKTVKHIKPFIKNNEAYYLNFVVRKMPLSDNELVTLIHEYCVYESFLKMGWLYTSCLPKKPKIKFSKTLFVNALKNKYLNTFIEDNKILFFHLMKIVECCGEDINNNDYIFGTDRFEYVWEALIDEVFGIKNKSDYFPNTKWNLNGRNSLYSNASLEPDTIMISDDKIYILDAKYYKYGLTGRCNDLPGSSSINKQITYGEFAAQLGQFKDNNIYNAFLMPFSKQKWNCSEPFLYIGDATSDWKSNNYAYEQIKGILVDTNYLLKAFSIKDNSSISRLSLLIEGSFRTS